ncbi:MAG TPA: RNA 2',3'-cyclic phosphodiesterase [Candidatus Binataceae bacterium]|nr:RNA 2',3'-cyclic phosphodiesterase [Candidatus Binataceae bacterium]
MAGLDDLPARIRAFIALDMNVAVKDAIDKFTSELRTPRDAISWVRGDKLHLTLRFLGDAVDSRRLPQLAGELEEVAAAAAPFVIRLRGTGAFPNLDRPRVLWIGLESPELIGFAARVEAAAVAGGFDAEPRPYAPHLTIARVREPHRFRTLRPAFEQYASRDFGIVEARAMTLYRSRLAPEGATYEPLAAFGLGATLRG